MSTPRLQQTEAKTQRLRMSYEEFLQWADEDVHAEWVDGEVIVHMPPMALAEIVGPERIISRLRDVSSGAGEAQNSTQE